VSRKVLETNTLYRYHRIDARNTAAAIAFAAFAADPDDILIITPSDHILMEAYETAIQEAVEKHLGIHCYFWDCTYKTGSGIWIHRAQRDDVFLWKNQPGFSPGFYIKEIFFGTVGCFV
jgi:mannose-1-phosphate guanylyltransferase